MKNHKVLVITIITAFSINLVFSQELKFKLYGLNPCTGHIEIVNFYSLKKDNNIYMPKDSTGVCILPEKGTYSLLFQEGKIYNFSEARLYLDTLKLPVITFCYEPITHPSFSGYCCCGSPCEGTQVDYYTNGGKRIEGFFKNGKPIGNLKFYYPDGKIKQLEKYSGKGKLRKKVNYETN